MPRLNHRKARTGCQRCKARKVKCDEQKPRCGACARHGTLCDYGSNNAMLLNTTTASSVNSVSKPRALPTELDPMDLTSSIELRLMHEWTAYAAESFSTARDFWRLQVPVIAMEFRFVLDSILAVAALHASKHGPRKWNPIESRMEQHQHVRDGSGEKCYSGGKQVSMLFLSREYFNRAIDGNRHALESLTANNVEAVYVCSILVSFNALFMLGESEDDPASSELNLTHWMRLAKGTHFICKRWYDFAGPTWQLSSGAFNGKPNLTDVDELFAVRHRAPFARLLTWAQDHEVMTEEDQMAYGQALSYIGLIYTSIVDGSDVPLATCRRVLALPSRCLPRFTELIEKHQPRALTMLAHVFATVKLVAHQVVWFQGIAESQVPQIYERLPIAWRDMMAWPMAVASGDVNREPKETLLPDFAVS